MPKTIFLIFVFSNFLSIVSVLTDSLFMKKDIPLFKDQPMFKPDNFDEYWMNTPLKKIEE